MPRNAIELTLRDVRPLTPSTRSFVLATPGGTPLRFTPGQFVQVHFSIDGADVTRSYSVASPPSDRGEIELAVAWVEGGRGSRYLWGLRPGDTVVASGPYGRFCLRDEPVGRYLLVATGTGIAPYRTMLPELQRRMVGSDLRVELIFGCREPAEVLWGDELVALAAVTPSFRYTTCFSRVLPEHPQPWERPGYVQGAIEALDADPERDVVYLCGNPDMVDASIATLQSRGFSPFAIRREKYISGGA